MAHIASATPIATRVAIVLPGKAMMIVLSCLIVGVAGRDLNRMSVRIRHRLEKAQRTAVPRGDELHADFVSGTERIRSGRADAALSETGCGAEREDPRGVRAISALDLDRQRPVRIGEFDAFDGALQLLFRLHVVDACEGMMSLQRGTCHQPRAYDDTSQNSPNHCLASVKGVPARGAVTKRLRKKEFTADRG